MFKKYLTGRYCYLIQPLIIYYKDYESHNRCWDLDKNKSLDINDIDDSYVLDVIEHEESGRIEVMIPHGAKCFIKYNPSEDTFTITYKNIQCDISFDSDDEEYFFEEISDE